MAHPPTCTACLHPGYPAGYPVVITIDLSAERLPEMLSWITESRYLDSANAMQLNAQVGRSALRF